MAAMLLISIGVSAQDWSSPETESMLRTYVKQIFQVEGRVFACTGTTSTLYR